jgi:hypothetical protein
MKKDEIEGLVKTLHVRPSAEMYDRTLAETLEAQETWKKKSAAHRPDLWRIIMESKVTRYSAAVVTLAAALVLLGPFGTSKNGSIVWAEVVEKVGDMHTIIHKEEYVFWDMAKEEPFLEDDAMRLSAVKYASEDYGIAGDVFDDKGTLLAQVFLLKETQQGMIVAPTEKKYGRLSMPEETFNRFTGTLTPRGLVEYFRSGHYRQLGRARFDDFDVEGFEITDPNRLFPFPESLRLAFPVTDIVARIWIDVETSLPVGIEAEFDTARGLLTGFMKLHGQWRAYDFQWNAEIPEGIFEPNIPDDYTEFKVTDLIPPEVRAALTGLGIVPAGLIFWKRRTRAAARKHRS